jgi:hypothetical protein
MTALRSGVSTAPDRGRLTWGHMYPTGHQTQAAN